MATPETRVEDGDAEDSRELSREARAFIGSLPTEPIDATWLPILPPRTPAERVDHARRAAPATDHETEK